MDEKIVIMGSGAAAIAAIKAIRGEDKESRITVYGEERFYPYHRVRISKELFGGLEEEKFLLQKKVWYEENNIDVCLDSKIVKLIPEENKIVLKDGTDTYYTKLLLATGASNVTPPILGIDKNGVFTLRSLEDALEISAYLKDRKTIVLIGGGVQNLELAHVISKSGRKVIVVEFAPRLMPRQLDSEASTMLKKAIEDQGVEIMLDTQVNEILGENSVEGIITKNQMEKSCDTVIYSTGVKPNIQLARGAGLDVNIGIRVNARMKTNNSSIFAAGDAAEYNGSIYGTWGMALQQGKIAGLNMCGKKVDFEYTSSGVTANVFGIPLFSMGEIKEEQGVRVLVESDEMNYKYTKILISKNKVTGAIVLGDMKKAMLLKTAIEKQNEVENGGEIYNSPEELIRKLK
ncbi:MAG: FAD-dependent oxidoreductase [Bacillota bacterium]|nr:FAD-dependent oxidoreductase [Bacillota bacterium]